MDNLSAAMVVALGERHAESKLLPELSRQTSPPRRMGNGTKPIDRLLNMLVFGATDCWYFAGSRGTGGYGVMPALGETKAHRVSWRLFCGDIPTGLRVLHKCDVPNCVNPDHLFLGTQADNVRDMCAKGRQRTVSQHGEANPMARLNATQVADIRRMVANGATQRAACAKHGVSPMTVSRIVRGTAWKA